MSDKDLHIEDLDELLKSKKKKINSGRKGKAAERDIVHIFNKKFVQLLSDNPKWGAFSRAIGSGAFNKRGSLLPQHAKDTFTGDITAPVNFRFVLESKCGYNDADIFNCWFGKCRELDEFLEQVSKDSEYSGKKPMLLWKKDRKGRVVFLKRKDFEELSKVALPPIHFNYGDWVGIDFEFVLTLEDNFFFIGN